MTYYALLEELLTVLNQQGEPDLQRINDLLTQMCALFRIERAEINFYQTPTHEKLKRGTTFVCHDGGAACKVRLQARMVTPTMMIGIYRVYQRENAEPWTAEEEARVRRVAEMMLAYVVRHRMSAMAEMLAFIDDDGYHNSRYFTSQLEQLGHAGKLGGKAAVRFNLKHFSLINQQIGRYAGDLLMHNYCAKLEETIAPEGIVCRVGSDDFLLLCQSEQLQSVIHILSGTPIVYDSNTFEEVVVSASAGILVIPEQMDFTDSWDIMDKICSAYQDARKGRMEDIVFCNENMLVEREHVMRVQQLFPLALEREEFLVYYQPKIDVYGNVLAGAEALSRWYHDGKLIMPADFIPILEQNLDICKLDFYMLEHVCMDIRRWLDEGKKPVRVSVNLSRRHMLDEGLLDHIISIVDRYNVPHQYIEIELTETTTDVEFRDLKRVVNGLQNVGIYTSVDDFGIGYSSLNLIREIPWNVLKVDKNFLPLNSDDENSRNSVMFKYVVAMAHELGLECVAEGVETKEQIAILKQHSCHIAQGFYFDKPLPIAEFEKRLSRKVY